MQEWLRNQEWSEELWVAVWVIAVVLVSIILWWYGHFLKH
jgi:hypothetical protein